MAAQGKKGDSVGHHEDQKVMKKGNRKGRRSKSVDDESIDSNSVGSVDNYEDLFKFVPDETSMALQNFSKQERLLMMEILKLDSQVKQKVSRLQDLAAKIEKLKRKYVNAFRARNPDLRHFKVE